MQFDTSIFTYHELKHLEPILKKLNPPDHLELVMAVAKDPSELAYEIMEKLIAKPIYMCARGETSQLILDAKERPIPTPQGQYRGMPKLMTRVAKPFKAQSRKIAQKVDNRRVTDVAPNPKKPGSIAYAHFNQYVHGKSVTWHVLNTDITLADIRYDASRKYIKLKTPLEYPAVPDAAIV